MTEEELIKLQDQALQVAFEYRDIDCIKFIYNRSTRPEIFDCVEAIKLAEDQFTFDLLELMPTMFGHSHVESVMGAEFSEEEDPRTFSSFVKKIRNEYKVPDTMTNTDIRKAILKSKDYTRWSTDHSSNDDYWLQVYKNAAIYLKLAKPDPAGSGE